MPHLGTVSDDGRFISVDADDLLYPRIRRLVFSTPWAILPEKMAVISELIALRSRGMRFSVEEIQSRIGTVQPRSGSGGGAVAVIPVFGVLSQRMNLMSAMSGGTSTEQLGEQIRDAMNDDAVSAIVFDVESPGGNVNGIPELADEIASYRGQKPMVAVANPIMASGAYWLMSQCNEIVVTPSGEVGSIGVITAHEDWSAAYDAAGIKTTLISAGKFKAEGNPFEPLSQEARDAIQSRVDDYYGMFVDAVARGRGTTSKAVRAGFGEGRVVGANDAVRMGMADRVDTLKGTIARLSSGQGRARVKASIDDHSMTASEEFELAVAEHEHAKLIAL